MEVEKGPEKGQIGLKYPLKSNQKRVGPKMPKLALLN